MPSMTDLQLLELHRSPSTDFGHDHLAPKSNQRMYEPQGSCAFRDTCGKKSTFGAELPCPYDGPPLDVRFRAFRRLNADATILRSIIDDNKF
jgi:hypothetical protein